MTRCATGLSLLLVSFLLGCASSGPHPKGSGFVVLSINDTYRLDGVNEGTAGGFARVRALRERLESDGTPVLMLHAGDLLYPSLESRRFDGAQMVDLLNLLDGEEKRFDSRLVATFGNHEFDQGDLEDAPMLQRRMEQSDFRWLATNIAWQTGDDDRPRVAAGNLVDTVELELGGLLVGIFSLTTSDVQPEYVAGFGDPAAVAHESIAGLRARGVDVVIALTHQTLAEDVALLNDLGDSGPDLVIGGHEHQAQTLEVRGRYILKADADAASARVARVSLGPAGALRVEPGQAVRLAGDDPAPDRLVARRVSDWQRAYGLGRCVVDLGLPADCMEERVGVSRTGVIAEEISIRKFETNFGNWLADLALAAFADRGSQVAFLNAGSLRLNQDLTPGTPIRRRHVEELLPYPTSLRLVEIDGATLGEIARRSVSGWNADGWWLQVSGFAFRHDPSAQSATGLTLLTDDGPRPIAADEVIRAVTTRYLVDSSGPQDGYRMLGPEKVIAEGPSLRDLVVAALAAAEPEGIAPTLEGRICNSQRPGPCLATDG